MTITRTDAESLLKWASEQNPGAWVDHSKTVARAAETIAATCSLDRNRAYVYGLLHDIGRYEGWRYLHHVVAGYRLMTEKRYGDVARICLTHSFPVKALGAYSGDRLDCTPEDLPSSKTSSPPANSTTTTGSSSCATRSVCRRGSAYWRCASSTS